MTSYVFTKKLAHIFGNTIKIIFELHENNIATSKLVENIHDQSMLDSCYV